MTRSVSACGGGLQTLRARLAPSDLTGADPVEMAALQSCNDRPEPANSAAPACVADFAAAALSSPSAVTVTAMMHMFVPGAGCELVSTISAGRATQAKVKPRLEPAPCTDGCNYTGVGPYSSDPYVSNNPNGLTAGAQQAITYRLVNAPPCADVDRYRHYQYRHCGPGPQFVLTNDTHHWSYTGN